MVDARTRLLPINNCLTSSETPPRNPLAAFKVTVAQMSDRMPPSQRQLSLHLILDWPSTRARTRFIIERL